MESVRIGSAWRPSPRCHFHQVHGSAVSQIWCIHVVGDRIRARARIRCPETIRLDTHRFEPRLHTMTKDATNIHLGQSEMSVIIVLDGPDVGKIGFLDAETDPFRDHGHHPTTVA